MDFEVVHPLYGIHFPINYIRGIYLQIQYTDIQLKVTYSNFQGERLMIKWVLSRDSSYCS